MRPRSDDLADAARELGERLLWTARTLGRPEDAAHAGAPRDVVEVMRAAVAGHATGDTGALAALQQQSQALVEATTGTSFFDALRLDALPGMFHATFAAATTHALARPVAEGRPIPATRFDATRKILREQTAASILVVSAELLRHASAADLLEVMVRTAVARATDAEFIAQLIAAVGSIAAAGNDSEAVFFDLRRGLENINSSADALFHVAVGTAVGKRLAMQTDFNGARAHPEMTPTGGRLANLPCTVTDALTDDAIVADARGILAVSGEVRIDAARAGAIEMDTVPTNASNDGASPPAPVEQNMVSMFQTNSVALKAQRQWDWSPLRSACAIRITGVGSKWGLTDTSPPL